MIRRKTVANPVLVEGRGLHSGVPVRVTIHPGDAGIWFRSGADRIKAEPANVTDTTRCTRLGPVSTIEHLMSALAGLEITDAEIEVDGPELPGLDGSARPFCDAILRAGITDGDEIDEPRLFSRLYELEEGGRKLAIAKGAGHWRYLYDVSPRWPGAQEFESLDVVTDYLEQIAPARTLVLTEELAAIQALGLGQGLDEQSVVILGDSGYQNEPRFGDEPARHKLLDLIGDLYLAGIAIRDFGVVAERTGHRSNVAMAAKLKHALDNS